MHEALTRSQGNEHVYHLQKLPCDPSQPLPPAAPTSPYIVAAKS